MNKIILNLFLLVFIGSMELFSQELNTSSLFSNLTTCNSPTSVLISTSKLLQLRNFNNNTTFASTNISVDNISIFDYENNVNHHPLIFAKINFFGINNLEKREDEDNSFKDAESSIWDNEIVYFVIGAVAATTLYLVWQNSGSENKPQKTFGLPPKPEGNYGL